MAVQDTSFAGGSRIVSTRRYCLPSGVRALTHVAQILKAEEVASGKRPAGNYDPEQEYPQGEEDEFEDVTVSLVEGGLVFYCWAPLFSCAS